MNIIPFQGFFPDLSLIPDKERYFATVKEEYRSYVKKSVFSTSAKSAFYIIRIQNRKHSATGLICTTGVDDYLAGRVLRHEDIIHQKERIQIELLEERQAVVKPILLVHENKPTIEEWLHTYTEENAPLLEVQFDDGENQLLWEISAPSDIAAVQSLYQEQVPYVAIADGHHRFSSFATLAQEEQSHPNKRFSAVLSAYFPEKDLTIDAFHRLIEMPRPFHEQDFLNALRNLGKLQMLSVPQLPANKHQMSICLSMGWYSFSWDPEILQTDEEQMPMVDVNLLNQYILQPLLEVDDIQDSTRIHYLEGNRGIAHLESSMQAYAPAVGFALHPIQTHDFLAIVSKGLQLVPKATFFEPRLKNGLLVQQV